MAVEAKVMEHLLDFASYLGRVLVAVIACSTARIVYKVMVTLHTLGFCVIAVIEYHWQQWFFWRMPDAIGLSRYK
jgi:putative flippase GtrA